MKGGKNGVMHLVWHLLETFEPDRLEQYEYPDRSEIQFSKNGIEMKFWSGKESDGSTTKASIEVDGNTERLEGSYSHIIKRIEDLLEERK